MHTTEIHQPAKMKGKVKMSAIEDVNDRMTTYKKRKETLIRKMEEITNLCGVEASLIVYNEVEVGGGTTWPDNHKAVLEMVEKVKFDMGKRQDMYSLVAAMVAKEKVSQTKLKFSVDDKEARVVMSELFSGVKSLNDLWLYELEGVKYVIDDKLRSLRTRMRTLIESESLDGMMTVGDGGGREQAGTSGGRWGGGGGSPESFGV